MATRVIEVDAAEAESWLRESEAVLIDVREPFEHAAERIDPSVNESLSTLDPDRVKAMSGGRRVLFHCRTGKRSHEAALKYGAATGAAEVHHLAGGIEAWKSGGRPTERSSHAPRIDVMRQVQMTAGSLVLAGVVLGTLVSPAFLILSGFVGGGLVFAGASGWCGMAKLLALMPWNRLARTRPS
ncbi:MAG: rhodanese-like domain-containing protein [Planctomycetota bacterium]|jgi:rhodanese-related sulfurtransferase